MVLTKKLGLLVGPLLLAGNIVAMEGQVEAKALILQKAMGNNEIGGIVAWGASEIGKSSLQDKEIADHVIDPLKAINQGLDTCVRYARDLGRAAKNDKGQVTNQLAEQQYEINRQFARNLQSFYQAIEKFFDLKNIEAVILVDAQFNIPRFSEITFELLQIAQKVCISYDIVDIYLFLPLERAYFEYATSSGRLANLNVECSGFGKNFDNWTNLASLVKKFANRLKKVANDLKDDIKKYDLRDDNGDSLEPVANAANGQYDIIEKQMALFGSPLAKQGITLLD